MAGKEKTSAEDKAEWDRIAMCDGISPPKPDCTIDHRLAVELDILAKRKAGLAAQKPEESV